MSTPDSPEHRKYLNRVDTVARIVVAATVVCVIVRLLTDHYVSENTYASGYYYGSKILLWAAEISGIGIIPCLLALIGVLDESLLRAWNRRPLTRWELLAAVPCGLLACFAVFVALYVTYVAIGFGGMLCGTFAFDSVIGVLAIGLAACSLSVVGLVVYVLVRFRHARTPATNVLTAAMLLGLVACVMLAVFVLLRAAEGRKQHESVAVLGAMTQHVYYDYDIGNDGHAVISKGRPESWVPNWLISLAGKDFFHHVVRVDLKRSNPNVDDVLPHLRRLASLKYVVLSTEVPAATIGRIEQALPSCAIKFTEELGSEESTWASPPVH